MPATPSFSIITVCRNARGSIEGTLDSLKSQSIADYELIVIDGSSMDGTQDLARKLTIGMTVRIVSEPDGGIYEAMNKGLRFASGRLHPVVLVY